MTSNSLNVLEENLVKKISILDKLQVLCARQEQLLNMSPMPVKEFDQCMDEQDDLVSVLTKVDTDFDELYESIKEELTGNREHYGEQMLKLKQLVSKITAQCSVLQEQEKRNKDMVMDYFQKERENLGAGRRSSKAALDYYKNMSKSNVIPPQFMDKKQ